ncbi:uncharacterized protein [Montipora foliosa]|uniref:uncharacterized protein isoform X2 n=1 Tax=Montipora foliosa TaxID=591990 RepID=UPI0035F189FD
MKIYLVEVLISLSLCVEQTLLESIEIRRFIGEDEDSFYIPRTVCDQGDSRYEQYCASGHDICERQDTVTDNRYLCSCPRENATLTYRDNLWRCRENVEVRRHLGCEINNIFHNEDKTEPLRVLSRDTWRRTKLKKKECYISPDISWYIGCDGKRETLKAYQTSFDLRWKKNPKGYSFKVLDDSYQGQIIKLGIRCTSKPQAYINSCFLFKVQGNVSCPLGKQETDRLSSTTAAFSETTSTPSKMPRETSTQTKQSSTEGRFQPSSGVRQTDDSTSQVPVIVGVTASIIFTIVLLVVAFLICRRYKSRQEKNESKKKVIDWMLRKGNPTANSETDTSQTGNSCDTLEIPGGNTYGDQNVNESDYSVPQGPKDESLYYGSVSIDQPYTMEPTYNVLEEPYPDSSKSPSNHGTLPVNEPFAEEGPYTMEPTYNVLEEPYPDSSKSPSNHGTLSVNEPFYNSLERSYSNDGFGDNQGEVVYNTLEKPGVTGTHEEDNYSNTALNEYVYNVLDRRGIQH